MNNTLVLGDSRQSARETYRLQEKKTFDLTTIAQVARKRLWLIGLLTFLFAVVAVYRVSTVTPQYSADAQMLLGDRDLSARQDFDLVEAHALSKSVLEGELAIMRSGAVLSRVAEKLELSDDPEFNPALRPPAQPIPIIDPLRSGLRSMLDALTGAMSGETEAVEPVDPEADLSPVERAAQASDEALGDLGPVIRQLRRRIGVRQQGTSFVIGVSASAETGAKASAIVNTVMDEYAAFLVDRRFRAAQRFARWLEGRVTELSVVLETSEKEALAFRATIEANADSSIRLEQQMQEMTSKLVDARARLADALAQAEIFTTISERDGLLAAADLMSSPTVVSYREQLNQLRQDEAAAVVQFGEDAPRLESIRRAGGKIEESLEDEAQRSILNLKNASEVAQSIVSGLETSLLALEGTIRSRSNEQIRLRQLELVADANRRVYEDFLSRFKQTSEIQSLQTSDAEVITYATPPTSPTYPRKKVTVILASLAGMLIGLALALILEIRPRKLKSGEVLTERTGLPVIARLPQLPASANRRNVIQSLARSPSSRMAGQAVRLCENIDLTFDGMQGTIAVAANVAGRDKSSVATLLAWAAVQKGQKVLLIDADTQTASLTRSMGLEAQRTLGDVLYERAELTEAIVDLQPVGLHFLPGTVIDADPSMLFNTTARANRVFQQAKQMYDVVVVDTPALTRNASVLAPVEPFGSALLTVPKGQLDDAALNQTMDLFETMPYRSAAIVMTGDGGATRLG